MIYAATIIYFNEKEKDKFIRLINSYYNIELYEADYDKGKAVITIEAVDERDIKKVEEILLQNSDIIIDVIHHAFHFEDEVDKALSGQNIPSLKKVFKSFE